MLKHPHCVRTITNMFLTTILYVAHKALTKAGIDRGRPLRWCVVEWSVFCTPVLSGGTDEWCPSVLSINLCIGLLKHNHTKQEFSNNTPISVDIWMCLVGWPRAYRGAVNNMWFSASHYRAVVLKLGFKYHQWYLSPPLVVLGESPQKRKILTEIK